MRDEKRKNFDEAEATNCKPGAGFYRAWKAIGGIYHDSLKWTKINVNKHVLIDHFHHKWTISWTENMQQSQNDVNISIISEMSKNLHKKIEC